jgi:hypothetical protein
MLWLEWSVGCVFLTYKFVWPLVSIILPIADLGFWKGETKESTSEINMFPRSVVYRS